MAACLLWTLPLRTDTWLFNCVGAFRPAFSYSFNNSPTVTFMRINSIAKFMWAPNARQVNVPIIWMRARIWWFSSWCKNWHVASCIHADTVRHSARPWYLKVLNIQAIEFSSEMHSCFSRRLVLFAATVLQQFTEGLCQSLSTRRHFTRMHSMQVRASANAAHAVGFMCCNCDCICDSRLSMECHRRHITSLGTPCADPSSYKSLSFTGRADMSAGILRQHDGTLGSFSILCSILLP